MKQKEFNLSERHEELSKRFYKELKKMRIGILGATSLIKIVAETWENDKEFIKILKEEINNIQKINVENSHTSGVLEPLRKTVMELIVGCFMELEDRINKLSGDKLK